MCSNITKRVWIVLAIFVCLGFDTAAADQINEIRNIELTEFGPIYRIKIECTGPLTFGSFSKESPFELTLYFPNAKLAVKEREVSFRDGPVRLIKAEPSGTAAGTVNVVVTFADSVFYEIKKDRDNTLYVDIHAGLLMKSPYVAQKEKSNGSRPANHSDTQYARVKNGSHDDLSHSPENERVLNNYERISIDVRDAELANVLRLISKQSNLNLIVGKDVTGKISVSLSGVTLKDALDNIVRGNGYDYIINGDIIVVKPVEQFQLQDLQTRIFQLHYVDAKNVKTAISHLLSDRANTQIFYQDFHGTAEEQEGGGSQGQKEARKSRSSTLIITDTPNNIQQVSALIRELDQPTPQIMIEAKLIEVSPQHNDKLGIDWSKTINAQLFKEIIRPSGAPDRVSVEVPLNGSGVNYGTLSFSQFNAVLDFLNSNTHSKLISNPRILAMDNQEAEISVGTNVPIPQITRGIGGQPDIVTFQYRDVNISLRVTPHIGEDETITLYVNPVIEEITGQVIAGENSAPVTSKREVQTIVKVKSDETIVIGGLIKENTLERVDKVWLLGDVPLLGNAFRHKDRIKQQTDLLIFITPRLLE